MENEAAEPEEVEEEEEEVPERDSEKPEDKPEEKPEADKAEEEKKKPTKPDQKKKKDTAKATTVLPTLTLPKLKLKRVIEIMKTGKYIIKDDKFKKLKKHPSLGVWDPFLEVQYTKSEIKLFEIKKRKLLKKPKGTQQKQFKTSKPLVKTFKHLVDERRGGKKVKKAKLTKLQKQKLKLKNKLCAKSKKAGCTKYLVSRRICRLLKKLKFVRISTEKKPKPKIKKKPKIIKIKKTKKSKTPKKTGEVDPKKVSEQESALKSKHIKKPKKTKGDKGKGKDRRNKTKKRHKLKDAKKAERKRKKKQDKEKQENEEKKSKKQKDIKEDKEKSRATKQKTVKIAKEPKEAQSKPVPKPKEDKKPKPLKTNLGEKPKPNKPETKKVQKKTKKVKIKRTVLCKFKKRYEYREIVYIDFKSPEITTDEDSMKTGTTSTIPRTTSEQYLKFRKKNEKLEKIKQKLIDELIHSLKSDKLEFVEMLKYEPVLKLFLNKKHLLSKFEIIEILNRNLNILNHKIDRIRKYSKNFIKNTAKHKEYNDNLLFREIKRIYSDYVDVLEILKFKFDIVPEEILKTPLENLIKLQNYQPEFLFKRVRFKYLKNIKKAIKERNKELKLLNKKFDYVVSDAILEEIFNSYVPLNLVFDDIPTFMVNDIDYQLQVVKSKNLLFFKYCKHMDQEWDVTLDLLNMESDVVALTKYNKRDIILEKYKRLQLEKPKKPPGLPLDVMLKRVKLRKAIRRIDTNYNWNRRVLNFNTNSYVMPPVDCKYATVYERPNRSLYKDPLNEKIILVRDEFKKHDVFLDPIKQLTEIKHIFEKMDIDWANYPKEKQQKRQLKFSIADYLFRTMYPEGFPRRRLDYFVYLNRVIDDINKNAYKNVFDLTYQETDESSSEPRIIKKSGDTKEAEQQQQQQAPVIYEEEEFGEGEEMEEERSVDQVDQVKMYEKPVKIYSESDFEGSDSTDRSSFVFDYIENEYNRMMNAFRKMKFDNGIQPEFTPKVQNSTQIHIEFDNVNKNVCEQVCQYNIKTFYSECIKKKLIEEEEARRKKYLYYIVLETPITWEIPQPPQSLLNARIKLSKAKFLKRICNYNVDVAVLLEYFKDIFTTKTMPGVMRTFNYLWNFGVKGSYGYKVVLVKWYPSRNDLMFVLFSKKRQINYGRSIQDKIGHMFVIELQYWHKPARFIKFPAAPVILEFNPQRLNYMAIVLKTCEIQIYNLALSNYNKYKPILTTPNILFRLKIVNFHWITDSKINESNYLFFFTFSRCGHVDKWQIHRTYMSVTPHIRIDETMGPTFDFTTVEMGVDISCVAFHPYYRTVFLLGTCTGLLYRCTTEHVNNTFIRIVAYDDNLKSIQFNILVPKIFLTYGDFRLIKIWDFKMLSCIYEINTEDYITCIQWAPFSSTVFVVAQTKALFVYDLNLNENNEIAKQNIYDKDSSVTTITAFAFHHAYDYAITVGCNNGELCLIKLAPVLRGHILRIQLGESQPNTMENQLRKVQFMLDSHRDYHDSESESDTTDSENFGVLIAPVEGGEEKEGGEEGEGGGAQAAGSDED